MSQKVIVVGNSLAVTISKDSARKMGIKAGTRVDMKIDSKRNIISFHSPKKLSKSEGKIARLTADFMERYDADLRDLANR